jgi:hypothetical protein
MLILSYPVYIHDWRNKRLLKKSLKSTKSAWPMEIHLVINGCAYPDFLEKTRIEYGAHIVHSQVNSVSGAWATAIQFALQHSDTDVLLLANQDTEFPRGTLEKLTESALVREFVCGKPPHDCHRYSLWGASVATFRQFAGRDVDKQNKGLPDTQFQPAYYEDNDFDYRRRLSGMSLTLVDAPFKHAGSTVIRFNRAASNANEKSEGANRLSYIAKWGGEPGHEKFLLPYNGQTKPYRH